MNPRRRRERKEMLKSVAQQKKEMKPKVVTVSTPVVIAPEVPIIEESFPETEYAPVEPEVEVEAPVEVAPEPEGVFIETGVETNEYVPVQEVAPEVTEEVESPVEPEVEAEVVGSEDQPKKKNKKSKKNQD